MLEHVGLFCGCEGRLCNKCGQVKCYRAFSKDSKGKFGLSSWCKACVKSHQQANIDRINERRRENRREKADHYNEYNKNYHHNNPEPKKARDQKYRQKNIERVRAKDRKYGEVRRRIDEDYVAKRREYNREYIKLHPEKNAEYFNNRRARVQQAEGSFTSKEWQKLCARYEYTCLRCRRREPEIKLTADHVVPLCKGGTNFIDNIQPLCQSCNSSKHRATIDYRANWGKKSQG